MPPSLPSLPRICVAMGFSDITELSRAAEGEYKDGNTFYEFRLDALKNPFSGAELISKLKRKFPDAQVLATCRHRQNRGGFTGGIDTQIKILQAAAENGAVAVDLEIESAERAKLCVAELRKDVPVVISYHNFENTPALDPILRRLRHTAADIYKIATTARKPSDNLRLIQFAKAHKAPPLIVLAMSEAGAPTRILAPALGSFLTYATPNGLPGTAAGQIPARTMRSLYRCDKLSRQSRVYGVIADPVAHSKSPLIHNRAFQARRVDAVYIPFLIPSAQLSDWMNLASGLPVAGFSVTIPHKQRIMRYLDAVDPLAKRIGAVNTVWRKAGKWRGTNTDIQGIVTPLSKHVRLSHSSVLVAGYGGAARAAAISIAGAGAKVTVTGRNMKNAQALARAIYSDAISLRDAQKNRYDVLVHATPVGMSPKVDECLFNDAIPAEIVFDMVYNPHETLLTRRAAEQGATIIHGSEMFLEQAVCQFEIWTGESAPRSVMQTALEQSIC